MIKVKNLSKKYNDFYVLKNINLSFSSKGLIGISGESGSGKTTLLNAISLIDDEYEGEIIVNGKNILKYSKNEKEKYRKSIGYVFQKPILFEFCSVKDNVKLLSMVKGKQYEIESILKQVKMDKYSNKLVSKLSGGQRQRVSIASTIVSKPNILLCDEPTGALDHENSLNIMRILKEISKDKLVLIVSHDIELLKEFVDYSVLLENGEVKNIDNVSNSNTALIFNKSSILSRIKFIFYFAFKNIFHHKKRTFLTSIIISIGLSGIIFSILLKDGFSSFFTSSFSNYEINKYMYCYSSNSSEDIEISLDTFEEDFNKYSYGYFYKYEFLDKRNKILLNDKEMHLNFNNLGYLIKDNEKYLNNEIGLCCSSEYIDYLCYLLKVDNVKEINDKLKNDKYMLSFEYLDKNMNLSFKLRLKVVKESSSNYTYFIHSSPIFLKEYFKKYISSNLNDNNRIVMIPYIESEEKDKNELLLDKEKKKYDYLFDQEIYDKKYDFVFKSNYYRLDINDALEISGKLNSKYIYSMINGIDTMGYFDKNIKFSSVNKEISGKDIYFIPDDEKYNSNNELSISSGLYNLLKDNVVNIKKDNKFLTFNIKRIIENDNLVVYQNSYWSYALFKELFLFKDYECIAISIAFENDENIDFIKNDYLDLEFVCPLKEVEKEIDNMVDKIKIALIILSSFCVIISLLLMGIIVFINTIEQSKMIGFLRINGINKKEIILIYLLESLLIGVISFIVASYVSFVFSIELNLVFNVLLENKNMTRLVELKKDTLINVFYLIISMSIISSIIPSLIIANKKSLKVIKD